MPAASRMHSGIDFDQTGKQVAYLGVPISTNESAYGTLTILIAAVNDRRGPRLLLTGSVHGDEYEGPVLLTNLARRLQAEHVQGRVILSILLFFLSRISHTLNLQNCSCAIWRAARRFCSHRFLILSPDLSYLPRP